MDQITKIFPKNVSKNIKSNKSISKLQKTLQYLFMMGALKN